MTTNPAAQRKVTSIAFRLVLALIISTTIATARAKADAFTIPIGSPDPAAAPSTITLSPTGSTTALQLSDAADTILPPLPLATLYTAEGALFPTSSDVTSDILQLTFPGPSTINFSLEPSDGFTMVRLKDFNLQPDATSMRLRVPLPPDAEIQGTLNTAFAGGAAIALMSASPEVTIPGADAISRSVNLPGVTHLFRQTDQAKGGSYAARFGAWSTVSTAGWAMQGISMRPTLKLADIAGIAAWVHGDGKGQQLKFQLIDENGGARDYYLPIDFSGWQEVSITSHSLDITTGDNLAGLNIYYNSIPSNARVSTLIDDVRAITPGQSGTTSTALIEDFENPNSGWWTENHPMLQLEWDFKYVREGDAAAIIACPQEDYFAAVQQFEKAADILVPYPGGTWNKHAAAVKENYLFLTSFEESQFDEALAIARRGGFKRVLILQNSWTKSTGHYEVNENNFPGGLPALARTADRFRANGIEVGFHLLAASIDYNDPYITPVPDPRLFKDAHTTLTHSIDPHTTTIIVDEMPEDFPAEDGGYTGDGTVLQIGDELIRYTSRTTTAPFIFSGCTRGHLGTRPSAHAARTPIHHLARSYGYHMYDMDTTLLDEVTSNFAAVANACKIDMMYLDGAERLQGAHGRYNARLVNAFLSKLDNPDILVQASSFSHFSWHQLARSASADGHGDLKGYLEQRAGVFESFKRLGMPLDIGWYYGYDATATPDMYEYILAATLANDSAFSYQVSVDAAGVHPFTNQILDLIKRYEALRTSGRITPEMKQRLQVDESLIGRAPEDESRPTKNRREYRLLHEDGRDVFQRVIYGQWQEQKIAEITGSLSLDWQVEVTTGPSAIAMQLHLFPLDNKSTVTAGLQNPMLEIAGQRLIYKGKIINGQYVFFWPNEPATLHGPTADDITTGTKSTPRINLPAGTHTARLTADALTTGPVHLRVRANLLPPERHELPTQNNADGEETEPAFTVDCNTVTISPGRKNANGQEIIISTTATLSFPPADIASVRDEISTLPATLPHMWFGGNLRQVRTANAIPGSFIPESLKVRLQDGTLLQREKDYVVEDTWASIARTPNGRITTDTVVLVDYDYSLMRLDGIDVTSDGQAVAVTGEPHLVCPEPPEVTTGALRLAHVFQPYKSASIKPWQIFPIGAPFPEPTHEQQVEMSRPVRKTLQKLRDGKPVTIVTWGDSVTVGGDASRPELAFANLFVSRLKERFPQASIQHINAGIGGTTTRDRLPGLEKDVLAHKPDLVTIEFVNDMQLPADEMQKNWDQALSGIKATGAEVVVITPHFTAAMLAMHPHPRGPENRPNVELQKKIAADHGVGMADTSRRWAHLEHEGIPYITWLYNGINHPNDAGHELFVKDLLNLFPAED